MLLQGKAWPMTSIVCCQPAVLRCFIGSSENELDKGGMTAQNVFIFYLNINSKVFIGKKDRKAGILLVEC